MDMTKKLLKNKKKKRYGCNLDSCIDNNIASCSSVLPDDRPRAGRRRVMMYQPVLPLATNSKP